MRMKILSLFMVMTMMFTSLSSVTVFASTSPSDDAGTTTLRPIDATYVSQHGTDNETNYFGEGVMKINNTSHNSGSEDYGQYGYMKFDVSDVTKERITSAKLRVYVENAGSKSSSTRTIGVYDTCGYDWDGSTLTWSNNPYFYPKNPIGTFNVTADGVNITDAGWREIDITDYVRDNIENTLSFMVKMKTWPAYNVVLSSGTYTGDPDDFDSTLYNENMPQIVIDYCAESSTPYTTTMLNPTRDTYVDQHTPSTNYLNDEYMQVNFTDNETRSDRYGRYAYMDFDISDIDKETLSTAKLWVYVDANSDVRNSTRTIGVFAPASTWSDSMTWSSGRVGVNGDAIGTYTVTGNSYDIVDYGWKCIDITDYVKSISSDTLSLMMQSINSNAHPVIIRSSENSNEETRPKLVITESYIDTYFEDSSFLNEVRTLIGKTNGEHIYKEDVENITTLDVSDKDITSLAGIEYFTGLKELYCYLNDLSELDLSHNTALEVLDCSYNLQLTSLNVADNLKLKELYCNYANLSKLDVTKNVQLTSLICFANPLGTIDVTKNNALQELDIRDAGLTMLDVSNNSVLTSLNCTHNYMSTIDDVVGWQTGTLILEDTFKFTPQRTEDITAVFTDENFLQAVREEIKKPVGSIYPSDLRDVTQLNVSHKGIQSLDGIEQFRSLQELDCGWNYLTSIDLSSNTMLVNVDCSENSLTELCIENNTNLEVINTSHNQLEDIDTSKNLSLKEFNISNNALTELDMSDNVELAKVDCSYNYLPEISYLSLPEESELSLSGISTYSDTISEDVEFFEYNEILVIFGPQMASQYLSVDMSMVSSGDIHVSGKTSPNSYVYIYDISDYDCGYDFADGEIPTNDILQEILGSDMEPVGVISTSLNSLKFDTNISNLTLRTEYKLVSIVVNEIDYDLDRYGKISIVHNDYYPIIKNFSIDNGRGTVTDLIYSDDNNSSSIPIIKFYGKQIVFTIEIENYENVNTVYVDMSRDDNNSKVEKYIEAVSIGDGKFIATDTISSGGEVFAYESRTGTINVLCSMNDSDSSETNKIYTARAILVIDPSGYIYEAVPSNRLKNVKTTLYYMNRDGIAVEWNAEEYAQTNPNITDETGNFEWFVPAGLWQVKAEQEGYETYYSEWLPVPPQQLDVNFGMISKETPSVKNVSYNTDGIEIEFSKYMYAEDMTTDNIDVVVDGTIIDGEIELINAEIDYWEGIYDTEASGGTGNEYVSKVKFIPDTELENGINLQVIVKESVRSYANVAMSEEYVGELSINSES